MAGWIGVIVSVAAVAAILFLDPTSLLGIADPAAANNAFLAFLLSLASVAAILGFLSPPVSLARQAAIWGAVSVCAFTLGANFSRVTDVVLLLNAPSASERVLKLSPAALVRPPKAAAGESESDAVENSGEAQAQGSSEPAIKVQAARTVEIKAGRHGHFVAKAAIDNTLVTVLIDTGATKVAVSYEDAERIGLKPFALDYDIPVSTANGIAKAASVTLRRVELDNVIVHDVEAIVMPEGMLGATLLGMSFLSRLSVFRISDDTLYLEE
jgi:aspartyl protease family protein